MEGEGLMKLKSLRMIELGYGAGAWELDCKCSSESTLLVESPTFDPENINSSLAEAGEIVTGQIAAS